MFRAIAVELVPIEITIDGQIMQNNVPKYAHKYAEKMAEYATQICNIKTHNYSFWQVLMVF